MSIEFQPLKPIGTDALPENIRKSSILTADNLLQLGSVTEIPPVDPSYQDDRLKNIIQYYSINPEDMENELQHYAKKLLATGMIREAWQVLLTII